MLSVSCLILKPNACEQSIEPTDPAAGPNLPAFKAAWPRPTWHECNHSARTENIGSPRRRVVFLLPEFSAAAPAMLPIDIVTVTLTENNQALTSRSIKGKHAESWCDSWKQMWWNEGKWEGGNQNKRNDDYFGSDSCWRVKDIPSQTPRMLACTRVGSVALVFILLRIQCVCVSQSLFLRWYVEGPSRGECECCGSPPRLFFSALVLEPGALMFQHADVGKRPAAPVVVPVSLALPLQSPSAAACRRHAAAGTGAARAPVFKHADF